jgi:hypothetical protein
VSLLVAQETAIWDKAAQFAQVDWLGMECPGRAAVAPDGPEIGAHRGHLVVSTLTSHSEGQQAGRLQFASSSYGSSATGRLDGHHQPIVDGYRGTPSAES